MYWVLQWILIWLSVRSGKDSFARIEMHAGSRENKQCNLMTCYGSQLEAVFIGI